MQELFEKFGTWNIAQYPCNYRRSIDIHKWACLIENRIKYKKTLVSGMKLIAGDTRSLLNDQLLPNPSIIVGPSELSSVVDEHNKHIRIRLVFALDDQENILEMDSAKFLDESDHEIIDWLEPKLCALKHLQLLELSGERSGHTLIDHYNGIG